jgi:hypothetical protein
MAGGVRSGVRVKQRAEERRVKRYVQLDEY